MTDSDKEAYLWTLSQAIAVNTGLSFPREKWADLDRALRKAAADLGFQDLHSCAQWLLEPLWSASRIEDLVPYLTIGETHFFRDAKLFQALEDRVLPELISANHRSKPMLRFWSAGCATGEEPYSLAMLASKIVAGSDGWEFTVLATDINRKSLRKAREGMYTQWSFREVPSGIREAYFKENRGRLAIVSDIKAMVKYAYLNLARDKYPHSGNGTEAMDLIFCRNVLMYFTVEQQKRVVANLCQCLVNGGWLIVSPAEATLIDHPKLAPGDIPGTVLFRKVSRRSARETKRKPALASTPHEVPDRLDQKLSSCWWQPCVNSLIEPPPMGAAEEPSSAQLSARDSEIRPGEGGVDLYNQGLYCEAAEKLALELERVQWQGPERDSKISLLIRSFGNQGKLDEALQWADQALATNALNAEHHYLSAMILQAKGNLEEAKLALHRAVFLDPDFVVAHFALGNLALLSRDQKESDRHYKIALRVLRSWSDDELIPCSDGMTARKLREIMLTIKLRGEGV